jgi:hypothetical protein
MFISFALALLISGRYIAGWVVINQLVILRNIGTCESRLNLLVFQNYLKNFSKNEENNDDDHKDDENKNVVENLR